MTHERPSLGASAEKEEWLFWAVLEPKCSQVWFLNSCNFWGLARPSDVLSIVKPAALVTLSILFTFGLQGFAHYLGPWVLGPTIEASECSATKTAGRAPAITLDVTAASDYPVLCAEVVFSNQCTINVENMQRDFRDVQSHHT